MAECITETQHDTYTINEACLGKEMELLQV